MSFFTKRFFSSSRTKKKEIPEGLWLKCPSCEEMLHKNDLKNAHGVCSRCDFHFRLSRKERIDLLTENGFIEEWDADMSSVDVLEFTGTASYTSKLKDNIAKTEYNDAVSCGKAQIGPHQVAFGVMDFNFLGASMGAVVGEKVTRLIEHGTEDGLPVVLVCASGGARMYEGLFSLMQMAKTSGALARHAEAGLAYIPILTHPTTAGVMASFATLGDVIMAEPDALIGFAGPRVIKETTQQDLPAGFQRSEFLEQRGLIDIVRHRAELKATLVTTLDYMNPVAHTAPAKVTFGDGDSDAVDTSGSK